MSHLRQILHLISSLDGYGESRQLLQLVEHQLAQGWQVQIVAFSATAWMHTRFEIAGTSCRVFRARWPFDPIVAYRLAKLLKRDRHDLLHIWGPEPLRYVKFVSPSTTSKPCVTTLSELPHESLGALVDRYVLPVQPSRVAPRTIAIAPGVAPQTGSPLQRSDVLKTLSLPDDSRLIGLAGHLSRNRGIEEAIWCFELVRTIDERAKLLIIGSGPDRHRLERFSRTASEPTDIRFIGYQENLQQWLPNLEVFWHLSRDKPSPSPPQTALEAMAAKVPVIATEIPAHREIIEAGESGFLFPVASRAICARHTMQILKDQEKATAIASAAAECVQSRFSLEAYQSAYSKLYEQLLS